MPSLIWATKSPPSMSPAALEMDSIVYPQGVGYPDLSPESQLILGDNLQVMSALLPEFEGRINLIYADPPFFTNRGYIELDLGLDYQLGSGVAMSSRDCKTHPCLPSSSTSI